MGRYTEYGRPAPLTMIVLCTQLSAIWVVVVPQPALFIAGPPVPPPVPPVAAPLAPEEPVPDVPLPDEPPPPDIAPAPAPPCGAPPLLPPVPAAGPPASPPVALVPPVFQLPDVPLPPVPAWLPPVPPVLVVPPVADAPPLPRCRAAAAATCLGGPSAPCAPTGAPGCAHALYGSGFHRVRVTGRDDEGEECPGECERKRGS